MRLEDLLALTQQMNETPFERAKRIAREQREEVANLGKKPVQPRKQALPEKLEAEDKASQKAITEGFKGKKTGAIKKPEPKPKSEFQITADGLERPIFRGQEWQGGVPFYEGEADSRLVEFMKEWDRKNPKAPAERRKRIRFAMDNKFRAEDEKRLAEMDVRAAEQGETLLTEGLMAIVPGGAAAGTGRLAAQAGLRVLPTIAAQLGVGFGTALGQEEIAKRVAPAWAAERARMLEENPDEAFVAQLIGSSLFFRPDPARMLKIAQGDRGAMVQALLEGGLEGGIEAAQQLATSGTLDPKRIGMVAAGGAILTDNRMMPGAPNVRTPQAPQRAQFTPQEMAGYEGGQTPNLRAGLSPQPANPLEEVARMVEPQPRMTREQIRAEAQKARASVPERKPFTPAEAQGYDPGQAPDLRAGLAPKPEVDESYADLERIGEASAKQELADFPRKEAEQTILNNSANGISGKILRLYNQPYLSDLEKQSILNAVKAGKAKKTLNFRGFVEDAGLDFEDLSKRDAQVKGGISAPAPEPALNPADPLGMREAQKVDDQWKTKSPVDYTDSDLASMKQAIERGMKPGAVKTSDMSASQRTQYPWHEETFSQFQSREENITRPTESVRDTHRFLVQQALSEGKPVPAEVLADYPDLMPKVEAPKPESVATPEQPQGKRRTFMLGGQEGARNYGTFETADLESLYQYATQLRGRGTGKAGRGKVGAGRTAAEQQAEASRLRPQMVERFGENVDDLARKVYDDVRAQAKEAGEDAEFVIRNRVQFGDQPAPTTTRAKIKQAEPKPESVATPEQPAKKTDKATQAKAQKTLQQAVPSGEFEGTRMERMAWAKEQGIEYRKIQVESEKAMSDARKMAESNNPRTYSEGMRILREPIMETQYVAYSADGEPLFKVTKTEFDLYDGAKAEGKPAKSPAPATNRLEEAKNARDRFYDELSKQPTPEGFKGTRSDWLGYEEREFALREFPDLYTRDEVGNVVRKPQPAPPTTRAKIKDPKPESVATPEQSPSAMVVILKGGAGSNGEQLGAISADDFLNAPAQVRREIGSGYNITKPTREWLKTKGINSDEMDHLAFKKAIRNGATVRPAQAPTVKPLLGKGRGELLLSTLDGQPAYSNAEVLVVGTPPKNNLPQVKRERTFDNVVPADTKPVRMVAEDALDPDVPRAYFAYDDGTVRSVNSGYISLIQKAHPGVTWEAKDIYFVAKKDGKVVGLAAGRNEEVPDAVRQIASNPIPQPAPPTTRAKIKQAANEARARIDEAASGGEMGAASGFNVQYLKDYATIVADELLDGLEVTIEGFRKRFGNIEQADFDRLMQDARAMADELSPASQPEAVVRPVETSKEPWQMTREEFKKARGSKSGSAKTIVREIAPNKWVVRAMQGNEEVGKATFVKTSKGIRLEPASMIYVEPSARRQGIGSSIYEAIESHTGLSLTPAGTRTGDGNAIWNNPNRTFGHRDYIDEAIAEGKPVPAEVLADYPDLRPVKTPKPATPVQSAPLSPLDEIANMVEGVDAPVRAVETPQTVAPDVVTPEVVEGVGEPRGVARQLNPEDAKAQVSSPEALTQGAVDRFMKTGGESGRLAVDKALRNEALTADEAADVLAWSNDLANRFDAGADVAEDLVKAENARIALRGQWSNFGRAMQGTLDELYQPGRVGARIEIEGRTAGLSSAEIDKLKAKAEGLAQEAQQANAKVSELMEEVARLREGMTEYAPTPKQLASKERVDRLQSAKQKVVQGILKKLGKLGMGIDPEVWSDVSKLVRLTFMEGGKTWREAAEDVQRMLKGDHGLDFEVNDIVDVSSGYAQSLEPKKAMNAEAERLYLARREEFLRSKLRDFGEVEAPAKPKMPTNVQIETLQGALKSKSEAQRIAELEDRIQKAKAGNVEQPRPRRLQSEEEKRLRRELNQLQARLRVSDEEWNARNLSKVQAEIKGLEKQIESGNLEARQKRTAFRKASEELTRARNLRNGLRRRIDSEIANAGMGKASKGIRTVKTIRRELQLFNPISMAKDVVGNISNTMATLLGGGQFDRALANGLLASQKLEPLTVFDNTRLSYVLREASPRWRQQMVDAMKGKDDIGGMRYDSTGPVSRFRGALDTPFRDLYERTMAYDLVAREVDPGTVEFDQAYQQALNPDMGGPLPVEVARSINEQSVQWANFNTYNNANPFSMGIEGLRKGAVAGVARGLGKTPEGRQAMRPVVEAVDFFMDELFRYSKVISNVAMDAATYANPLVAGGRAVALGIADKKKYGTIPPQTAMAMASMIRKGMVGMAAIKLGEHLYESGVNPEALMPVLVQSQSQDEEGDVRKGQKYVDEGQIGSIGAIFAPITMGYAQSLLDDALSQGKVTEKQYETLKKEWVRPWSIMLNQPAVSGPQRFLEDLRRTEGENWGASVGAGFLSAGVFTEWARLQDRLKTGQVRRDTKRIPGGKIIERYPFGRETLPSGTAGTFPGNMSGTINPPE